MILKGLCFNCFYTQTFQSHHHRWNMKAVHYFITLKNKYDRLHHKTGNVRHIGIRRTNNNPIVETAWVNCVTLPKATPFSKIIIFFPVVLQPNSGSWTSPYGDSWSHSLDTPHSVWLLWMSDQPDVETSTWQCNTCKRETSMPQTAQKL